MIGTGYWYMHTDQWRQRRLLRGRAEIPAVHRSLDGMHTADALAQSARLGWMPFYPQFDRNPLDLADEAASRRRRRNRPGHPAATSRTR